MNSRTTFVKTTMLGIWIIENHLGYHSYCDWRTRSIVRRSGPNTGPNLTRASELYVQVISRMIVVVSVELFFKFLL